jgi:hypothetical protein
MSKVETIEREILELSREEFAMLKMRLALLEKEQVAQENQNFEAALIESQSYISLPIAQRREQMRLSSIEAARLKIYDSSHEFFEWVNADLGEELLGS